MNFNEAAVPRTWSYSSLGQYETCPQQYKLRRIVKLPEPQHPAAARGETVHARGEQFLLGTVKQVPAGYEKFAREMRGLKAAGAAPELELAFTAEWAPTEWRAPDAWVRMKLDASVVHSDTEATVIDFKTGRTYPDHSKQAELYAIGLLSRHESLCRVRAEMWYLDSGELGLFDFDFGAKRQKLRAARAAWAQRAAAMLKDRAWLPAPSATACRRCAFRSNAGGPCEVWRAVL